LGDGFGHQWPPGQEPLHEKEASVNENSSSLMVDLTASHQQ
jgi:hypothetical protein